MIHISGFFKGNYKTPAEEFEIKGIYYVLIKNSIILIHLPPIDLINFSYTIIPDKLTDTLNDRSGYITSFNGNYQVGIIRQKMFYPINNDFNDWLMTLITTTYLKKVEGESDSYPFLK